MLTIQPPDHPAHQWIVVEGVRVYEDTLMPIWFQYCAANAGGGGHISKCRQILSRAPVSMHTTNYIPSAS